MADDKQEPFRKYDKTEPFRPTSAGQPAKAAGSDAAASAIAADTSADAPKAGGLDAGAGPAAKTPFEGPPAASAKAQKVKKPSRAPGLAAALIFGAIGGFGGAYAFRYVDAQRKAPDSVDAGAETNERAAALERKTEESAAAVAALESRVATVESNAGQAAAATEAALTDLRSAVAARPAASAEGQPADGQQSLGQPAQTPDLGPIREKIAAFEKKLGSLDKVQKKLGELETALTAPKAEPAASQSAKALAAAHSEGVVAASLLQLVNRGEPFSNEVAALENLGVDPAKLAPLRATAAAGVATNGDLADQFAALAPSLEDADAPTPETGVLDRLVRDASNLVRIRRAGDPHEADVPGRIAAIKAALARQDVGKAYAAWSQLPDRAKAKSESWGAAAKARLDALTAANAIEADAVAALSKSKS